MRTLRAWVVLALVSLGIGPLATGCGGGGGGGPVPLSVYVLYAVPAPAYAADVIAKLTGLGVFSSVVGFDAEASTPTLAQLQLYDVALVMSDSNFADSVTLGDNLADYVDAGGGVVLSEFSISDAGTDTPQGRFQTADYYAIPQQLGIGSDGPYGFTAFLPGHPILFGVSTFGGGSGSFRPASTLVHAGATIVAEWADPAGIPLVVTRTIGGVRRADLGFYPPTQDTGRADFVDPSTDAMLIVANALRWVGNDL